MPARTPRQQRPDTGAHAGHAAVRFDDRRSKYREIRAYDVDDALDAATVDLIEVGMVSQVLASWIV